MGVVYSLKAMKYTADKLNIIMPHNSVTREEIDKVAAYLHTAHPTLVFPEAGVHPDKVFRSASDLNELKQESDETFKRFVITYSWSFISAIFENPGRSNVNFYARNYGFERNGEPSFLLSCRGLY